MKKGASESGEGAMGVREGAMRVRERSSSMSSLTDGKFIVLS